MSISPNSVNAIVNDSSAETSITNLAHEDDNNIRLSRSDGKKHDLMSAASFNTNFKDLIIKQKQEEAQKQISLDDHDHKDKPISIRRSDGRIHDVIRVFKAFSDPRGDNFRLQANKPDNNSSGTLLLDGMRRSTLGKVGMQEILNSKGNLPLPPLLNNYHPTSVRIVHMSDTHNLLNRNSTTFNQSFLPEGDILIHSGNFADTGTDEEYAQFNAWLGSVSSIYHYRVVVAGNRDVKHLGNDWDALRDRLPNATHVLCHSEASILGIRIYGLPWHWGHEANYSLKPGAPDSNRYNDIPDNINILVTHGPAYGRLDVVVLGDVLAPKGSKGQALLKEEHWGSKDLADALQRARPALHLHGHVRGARGFLVAFGHHPLTVNSSMCGRDAKVLYACPHVIRGSHIFSGGGASPDPHPSSSKVWEFSIDSLVT